MWVPIDANGLKKEDFKDPLLVKKLGGKIVEFSEKDEEYVVFEGTKTKRVPTHGEFEYGLYCPPHQSDDPFIWMQTRPSYFIIKTYDNIYQKIFPDFSEQSILKGVYDELTERFINTAPKGEERRNIEDITAFWKKEGFNYVFLDAFIGEPHLSGIGVCLHQALTAAGILQHFKAHEYLKGKVYFKENHVTNSKVDSGHAWCQYKTEKQEDIIIDVAGQYYGSLEQGLIIWPYNKPNEHVITE